MSINVNDLFPFVDNECLYAIRELCLKLTIILYYIKLFMLPFNNKNATIQSG